MVPIIGFAESSSNTTINPELRLRSAYTGLMYWLVALAVSLGIAKWVQDDGDASWGWGWEW